ncbi:HAD-IIA family hydrolase [Halorussus litoreus]|uniref:HAD-IIA family hydrolase n=1 Tax=Halorussus litoreus TaxID=1710536 RepID=UPI000E26F94F|nr:HAD-IIA family hydrolase [Halorussus litoreus]
MSSGRETIQTSVEGAVVDLDGTFYRGDALIDGADDGVAALRDRGASVLFVTNKAIDRRARYREKLVDLGVPCTLEDLLTSATITADFLAREHPDRAVFVVGEEPLREELRAEDLAVTSDPEEAGVVVASMDREFDYATLSDALAALDDDTPFVATNPDRTCPVADGEIPDAAGMIGAIEGVTGRELDRVLGKPSATTIEAAMGRVSDATGHDRADPANCVMVGDRLETDIAMGDRAGMTTVLVLSGVTDRGDLDDASVEPDHVIESLAEIEEVLP